MANLHALDQKKMLAINAVANSITAMNSHVDHNDT